jgi:hypothetical protein
VQVRCAVSHFGADHLFFPLKGLSYEMSNLQEVKGNGQILNESRGFEPYPLPIE